ncbi:MAG: helix-hairpin-helix domain-containing protein [Abitibacteriaceae bacterium]|nr:helix-hairpin-helix domain-containing protein [Abditibacteriaceae bacterium]MBV9868271.1 helix-hairpin-helix domain-containing protein [Abditibacteriaceae bacterium]
MQSAGGATPDGVPDTLDLAAPVADGQQIVIPTQQQAHLVEVAHSPHPAALAGNAARSHSKSKKAPSGPVNINKASAVELETLPGIGPGLAQRIIEYRQQQGGFKALSDLDAVKGVGPKKLEKLSPYVSF